MPVSEPICHTLIEDWWISIASLELPVEVVEVVQGVEDDLPLRGISA